MAACDSCLMTWSPLRSGTGDGFLGDGVLRLVLDPVFSAVAALVLQLRGSGFMRWSSLCVHCGDDFLFGAALMLDASFFSFSIVVMIADSPTLDGHRHFLAACFVPMPA